MLYGLIDELLYEKADILQWQALFCIARQLFALGHFPQGEECLFHYMFTLDYDFSEENERQLPLGSVLSLRTEFFRNPLSLLQLSRTAIRRLLPMNDFERHVQPLPLPPLLLEYVWQANEMLNDVAPPEVFDHQPL